MSAHLLKAPLSGTRPAVLYLRIAGELIVASPVRSSRLLFRLCCAKLQGTTQALLKSPNMEHRNRSGRCCVTAQQ